MAEAEISEVHLEASSTCLDELRSFYVDVLNLREVAGAEVAVAVGSSQLRWRASDSGRPFYHFALLVPGQRFQAAYEWLHERVELLPHKGNPVVRFEAWDAVAAYFHDPAGSIVELIAHLGIDDPGGATGPFGPAELLGVSEVGLVVQDKRRAAEALHAQVGIDVWPASDAGALDDPGALIFIGRKAHTLILAPPGRGWLPTARPAESHPVRVVLSGTGASGSMQLPGGIHVRAG